MIPASGAADRVQLGDATVFAGWQHSQEMTVAVSQYKGWWAQQDSNLRATDCESPQGVLKFPDIIGKK